MHEWHCTARRWGTETPRVTSSPRCHLLQSHLYYQLHSRSALRRLLTITATSPGTPSNPSHPCHLGPHSPQFFHYGHHRCRHIPSAVRVNYWFTVNLELGTCLKRENSLMSHPTIYDSKPHPFQKLHGWVGYWKSWSSEGDASDIANLSNLQDVKCTV